MYIICTSIGLCLRIYPHVDDVIDYLAPTLEQHKGCAILDVFPGACLFSRKLHDYLKPERHILMEPDERYVEQYVKPLLDKPGSTYRHTPLVGAHSRRFLENYDKVLDDPLLFPKRPLLRADDPRLRQLDPSTLLIGNLARRGGAAGATSHVEIVHFVLHHLGYAALGNNVFNRNGLVRMLWWMDESYKRTLLPVTPVNKTAFSTGINLFSEPSEVAGVVHSHHLSDGNVTQRRRRPGLIDDLNAQQVAQRMEEHGFVVPPGRQLQAFEPEGTAGPEDNIKHISPFERKIETAQALQEKASAIRERFRSISHWKGALNQKGPGFSAKKSGDADELEQHAMLEHPQCIYLVDVYRRKSEMSRMRTPVFLDIALCIVNLEANYKRMEDEGLDAEVLEKLKSAILELDEVFYSFIDGYASRMPATIADMVEEQIAFYMDPQQLVWDRRLYEPLQANRGDFYPRKGMALFDMMPHNRDLSVPDIATRHETSEVCQDFLKHLWVTRNDSIPYNLDRYAISAAEGLIPQVPAITDVRRGGRLNPQRVRVRMLTPEMLEGLVKAYMEWPFRPGVSVEGRSPDFNLRMQAQLDHERTGVTA